MLAYYNNFGTFKKHIESDTLIHEIHASINQNVSPSEVRAWRNSLMEMYKVLSFSDLSDDVEIGIEYKLPISLKRIDFLIAGSNQDSNNVVIIELKQWSEVRKTDMPGLVEMQGRIYTHPSWQAYSYSKIISFFNEAVDEHNISFYPAAFLHNYKSHKLNQLVDPIYSEALEYAPVFIESDYKKLKDFIENHVSHASNKNLLYEIDNGKIRPSKMLIDVIGGMLNGHDEFTLIDEQKIVFEHLFKLVSQTQNSESKNVIIVEGGAGTGKTLIAIALMGKLITKKSYNTMFVSKSSYLRENFFKKLTKGIPKYGYLKTLFKGSGSFINSNLNEFDVLIVDEAHRLMEKTKRSWMYTGNDQVQEIIKASKTSIFFIDSKQQIDIKDHGSVEKIKEWALYYDAHIFHDEKLKLRSQFRCNGSDNYIQWVDSFLYNQPFQKTDEEVDYDIQLFDDIESMVNALKLKNSNNKARIISGDVFPWISRKSPDLIDIKIDNFQAQWNRTPTFATDPNSFNEVGCIHTTQGMEFEYVGLIIADDLYYQDNSVKTDYSKHPKGANEYKRPFQRSINEEDEELIDYLIRNTYRVLMSRGQKGVYIYCMDQKLHQYLEIKINELFDN